MIWRRRRPAAGTPSDGHMDEARAARADAEALAERVRAQWTPVRRVATALTRHQDDNHFADAVRAALRGDP